ncbi:hypothetical protein RRG08_021827 [Elysia crispata]|uniref:ribonuclease H n=1 Tax=Elysia crispata TaxID=231223 RepID=A0AAE1A013_9GAST|nr:hypothetical protein RRG08_021827 [Elysia crispata]
MEQIAPFTRQPWWSTFCSTALLNPPNNNYRSSFSESEVLQKNIILKANTRRVYRYLICCMLRFACRSCCLLFTMSKSGPWFYAVKHGRVPGVYNTWPECESQVKGFPKPIYKKFFSLLDAQKFVADEGIISTIPSGGTYFNTSMATPTSNHKNTMSSCMTASPCSSQNTVSTPRGAPVTLTSVNFEVTKMQGTINSLFGMMESLRSDVGHILDIVKRIETAAFIAPGTKRNFSTMAKEPDAMRDRKQSKKDKGNVGGFTGEKQCNSYSLYLKL